mgnify:CR=1 FL=1
MGIIKILVKTLLGGLALLFILLTSLYLYHTYQLKVEARNFPPLGELVEIKQKKIHIYREGDGDFSLVFLAGHGTVAPTLDFKPLWKRLSDNFRIIVIERAGYGWSEPSKIPRDIDTVLEESRKALKLAGESAPYVLIPHSMSGLEAIHWAQKYPEEVKAIIGLDPSVPAVYDDLSLLRSQGKQLKILAIISRVGVTRLMDQATLKKMLPIILSTALSKADKRIIKALFYRSALTRNMVNEIDYIPKNIQTIASYPLPAETPMLFFISDGGDSFFPDWQEKLTHFLSEITNGQGHHLACGHFVHYEKAEEIADEIKKYLRNF